MEKTKKNKEGEDVKRGIDWKMIVDDWLSKDSECPGDSLSE